MPSFKAEKLRVNLKLCMNRFKLLEKKKSKGVKNFVAIQLASYAISPAETAMKARREIADYMKSGRIERARIRVSVKPQEVAYTEHSISLPFHHSNAVGEMAGFCMSLLYTEQGYCLQFMMLFCY